VKVRKGLVLSYGLADRKKHFSFTPTAMSHQSFLMENIEKGGNMCVTYHLHGSDHRLAL